MAKEGGGSNMYIYIRGQIFIQPHHKGQIKYKYIYRDEYI